MNISQIMNQLMALNEDVIPSDALRPTDWKPPITPKDDTRPMSSIRSGFDKPLFAPKEGVTIYSYFQTREKPYASITTIRLDTCFIVTIYSGNTLPTGKQEILYSSGSDGLPNDQLFDVLLSYNLTYEDLLLAMPKDGAAYKKAFSEHFADATKREINNFDKKASEVIQEKSLDHMIPNKNKVANTAVLATDRTRKWVLVELINKVWYITPRIGAKAQPSTTFDDVEEMVQYLMDNGYEATSIIFSPNHDGITKKEYLEYVKSINK